MSQAKAVVREYRRKGVPVLGAAGLSLWLGGGASAAIGIATADTPTCSVAVNHEQTLREEEITDMTLSSFHIFDREQTPRLLPRIAAGSCVACAAWSEQPANNGSGSGTSPSARKPAQPYQTLKRSPERPQASRSQERPQTFKHQEQSASRSQRDVGARTTNQNGTRQAEPELDGLVLNQSAGQQTEPQMAIPVTDSAN